MLYVSIPRQVAFSEYTLKITLFPFIQLIFIVHVQLPIHAAAQTVICQTAKHWRGSIVKEVGLTNRGRHCLLLLYKQVHDKRQLLQSQQGLGLE